jgi:hypothetical protein
MANLFQAKIHSENKDFKSVAIEQQKDINKANG